MPRCLVTGGAGFIGSHVVEGLLGLGQLVSVLDNFSSGSMENLEKVLGRIRLFRGDVTDSGLVREAMDGVHYVFHLAGPMDTSDADADAMEIHQSGATGTLNVLLEALRAKVRRLIYASSCAVYEPGRGLPRREDETVQPLSPYGVAKLNGEHQCVSMFATHGLETVRLRYFNVFGPRQNARNSYARQLNQILDDMVARRRPLLEANKLEPQDFIFVDDVVHASILAAKAGRVAGRVYNIALGRPISSMDVVATMNRILGTRLTPLGADPGPGESRPNLADVTRAEVELGFCPVTDLEQGLRRCVAEVKRRTKSSIPLESEVCS